MSSHKLLQTKESMSGHCTLHVQVCSYLWLEMLVSVVGWLAVAYLLVGKVVSVSSVACGLTEPLHGCNKVEPGWEVPWFYRMKNLLSILLMLNHQLTWTIFRSWRGTLELWRPAAELSVPEPVALFELFFLFFFCLRRSRSFFLCLLLEKSQMTTWSSINHRYNTCRGCFRYIYRVKR